MPMDELRDFLQTNKHLPGIPSAAELEEKKGVELGDLQARMLKVVEEQALFGPLLVLHGGLNTVYLVCTNVDSTSTFNTNNGPSGLPGGTCFCEAPTPIGIAEALARSNLSVHPNPSTGIFTLSTPAKVLTVFTSTGQELFKSTGQTIDLRAYPPGLYHAVVQTAQGVGHVRLVVQR